MLYLAGVLVSEHRQNVILLLLRRLKLVYFIRIHFIGIAHQESDYFKGLMIIMDEGMFL
jgi:hypothetical protein